MMEEPRYGIDFGGVITHSRPPQPGEDTALDIGELEEIAQPGVFDAFAELVDHADGRVWIISKARSRMEAKTRSWLKAVDFFKRTGMAPKHLLFCKEREEKRTLCEAHAITHFVDDRVHVHQVLRHQVPFLFHFAPPEDARFSPPWTTFVATWADLLPLLRGEG